MSVKLLKEFKEFAIRGNAIDMAVGIIVGAGFTALVNSFVKGIFMPPFGLLISNADFKNKVLILKEGTEQVEAVVITYGQFFGEILNFILIAFVVFLLVRLINKWKQMRVTEEDPTPTTKNCQYCFSTISIKAIKCPACTADNP